MLIARRGLALLVLVSAIVLAVQLVGDLSRVKVLKTDRAELNHARYGMLDAQQWVDRISAILANRIDTFELTEANRPRLIKAVEQVLDTMLVEIERYLRQRNLRSGGTWVDQLQGVLQQGVQDLLIDFDKLRKKVPEYAEAVVEQLSKPEAKEEIKTQLLALLQEGTDSTFDATDRTRFDAVLAHYHCLDAPRCTGMLGEAITAERRPILMRLGGLLVLVVVLFPLCLVGTSSGSSSGTRRTSGLDPFALSMLTAATLVLLAGGLLTPMIEIEARITELSVEFLGEPLRFENQILYYQTKSIFEVVRILIETRAPDMWLVAVLITLFSIVFPSLKLIATYLYYYDLWHARGLGLVRFFALRSGKWSMADVLVIAIFMAYLGLDGLVGNQLDTLTRTDSQVRMLTTNGTALEPGFYLFLAFVVASLMLSSVLEARTSES